MEVILSILIHTLHKVGDNRLHKANVLMRDYIQDSNLKKKMSRVSLLNFQYKLSKIPSKQVSWGSNRRQLSGLAPAFEPNVNEMKRVFDKFDANKDGKISKDEYRSVLRALGKPNVENEVVKTFQVADCDGDGFIDFKEFMELHEKSGGIKATDIKSAFRVYDLDGNGRISAEELLEVLKRLGEWCNLEACRRMVRAVDADGDGLIDMDEFTKMMTHSMKLLC